MKDFEITPEELKERLDKGEQLFILDVREVHEHQTCKLEGSTLIPLGELSRRINELDPNSEMVVHCKLGGRSAKAVEFLKSSGFQKVRNLLGGIDAWAQRIDTKMPRY